MTIPDPRLESFNPAPAGKLRVAAWRHRTPTWPHPDLVRIHEERAKLMHWWAETYEVNVEDWGGTDSERPAEFVELLLDLGLELGKATLTAAFGALATAYVKRFLDRGKTKEKKKPDRGPSESDGSPPPNVGPLLGLTIVNESGGTVIVLDAKDEDEVSRAVSKVMKARWRGRITVDQSASPAAPR